ncbi:hypothetical protein LRR80_01896 [Streptomyces sp. RO-S4]|uniref:DUF1737 domain-containing protein n=1 Tax=unclassified Streptomyces TaxID=2593676 RepID=UPI00209663E9|nr:MULTISPECIES: DUF1737 domain-containing protein [unclassified Streptomyces]MCO4695844.1 hypothetical protein [Streptomyces sp. RO-S4]MDU0301593.1 DUF1737 domain-containing protein [Streptomyces sp. PAL114]
MLTGPDGFAFRRRVGEAPALGHRLHEGPDVIFDGERVSVAQAVVRDVEGQVRPSPETRKGPVLGTGPFRRTGF